MRLPTNQVFIRPFNAFLVSAMVCSAACQQPPGAHNSLIRTSELPAGTSCANGGSLVGTTYTTGAIVANCSVSASFIFSDVTVTATAGQNGTITPPSQLVPTGSTASFNVTPNAG